MLILCGYLNDLGEISNDPSCLWKNNIKDNESDYEHDTEVSKRL